MPSRLRSDPSKPPGSEPATGRLVWLGMVLASSQILLLVATQVAPLLRRSWQVRSESAVVRSARLAYGKDFADYVIFLREIIPDDALVVIPWREADPVLGEMPFMQYFLFPRRLTNCPSESEWQECMVHYGGPRTYLIAVDSFPPRSDLDNLKNHLMFDDSRGVLAPREVEGG